MRLQSTTMAFVHFAKPSMKPPRELQPLLDDGMIDAVLRPLKSGKEAAVYVVRSGDDIRCAKVYKDMAQRSFQQRVQYQEGRKVRGSRQARAMGKATNETAFLQPRDQTVNSRFRFQAKCRFHFVERRRDTVLAKGLVDEHQEFILFTGEHFEAPAYAEPKM